jgi:hypothetical protein
MDIEPLRERPSPMKKPIKPHMPPLIKPGIAEKIVKVNSSTSFHRGPNRPGKGYRLVLFSLAASSIDILISVSIFSLLLSGLLWALQVNMQEFAAIFGGEAKTFFFFVFSCLAVAYKVTLRIFAGCTLGDWACHLRLGRMKDRCLRFYSLRVLCRAFLILATGVILLPLLSLISGQDLAGKISGLYLVTID